MEYTQLKDKVGFTVYSCEDDHILYIKKAGYNDIDLYYVIMEDAYRTPEADVMTAEDIKEKFDIDVKYQTALRHLLPSHCF